MYLARQRSERNAGSNNDPFTPVAALARVEKDTEWLQRAIRERQAILGMTYREVEAAKGPPKLKQRGDMLPDVYRAKGTVENWVYDLDNGEVSNVLFGVNGRVIQSSDIGDKPGLGQVIRQGREQPVTSEKGDARPEVIRGRFKNKEKG